MNFQFKVHHASTNCKQEANPIYFIPPKNVAKFDLEEKESKRKH